MKRVLICGLWCAVIVIVGAGCGSDKKGGEGAEVALTGVELNESRLLMEVGESATLRAVFTPSNATNKSVEWSVSGDAVSVADGVVTAEAIGNAVVTVRTEDGGFTASCNVAVVLDKDIVFVQSIEFAEDSYAIIVGEQLFLIPDVLPENADNRTLNWSVQPGGVVSVNASGEVEALAVGQATVTASATDGSGIEASVDIYVSNPVTEVVFGNGQDYCNFTTWHGNNFEIELYTTPSDADWRTMQWTFMKMNGLPNPAGVSYEIAADKATVCCVIEENTTRNGCKVEIEAADNFAYADIDFLTYPWIMKSKDNGATFSGSAAVLCETSDFKFNYEPDDYLSSTLYFVAYCPKDSQYQAVASPLQYYPDDIIPTSAYTLTSSDPEKLALEKLADKGYRLKILADELSSVKLTYTCGEHTQTYTINIIP